MRPRQRVTPQITSAIEATSTIATIATSGIWSGNAAGRLGAIVRRRKRFHMGHNVGMEEVFAVGIFVVVSLSVIGAAITFAGSSKAYSQIGRGAMSLNEDLEDPRRARRDSRPAAVVTAERNDEIRQLLTARNERRARRGEAPIDIEAELQRLTAPAVDAGLRDEVRSLVIARNERRLRQGKEALDVEAETERQLRELSG
jgi:hypothetical protein